MATLERCPYPPGSAVCSQMSKYITSLEAELLALKTAAQVVIDSETAKQGVTQAIDELAELLAQQ